MFYYISCISYSIVLQAYDIAFQAYLIVFHAYLNVFYAYLTVFRDILLCFKQFHQLWVTSGSLLQNVWDYTYVGLFDRNDLLFTVAGIYSFSHQIELSAVLPVSTKLILLTCIRINL